MAADNLASIPISLPRALIADDSRIVRATLCKHLGALYTFSEALDGEQAWEILLRDQDIDLLITDLTMPRLDGYGLLGRMRASPSQRLREMPVVVISGTDDADERRQAKDAGATDLITKGMPTAQLQSRLELLAQLVAAQKRCESGTGAAPALSPYAFQAEADQRLGHALRHQQDFALLNLSVGASAGMSDFDLAARLRQAIRQTDLLACTGAAEFSIATSGLDAPAVRGFAGRLCAAASQALAANGSAGAAVVVSCGTAVLSDLNTPQAVATPSLHELWDAARRRNPP
ncbi:MAG: response regulator [Noviherbaspirillum sp.]